MRINLKRTFFNKFLFDHFVLKVILLTSELDVLYLSNRPQVSVVYGRDAGRTREEFVNHEIDRKDEKRATGVGYVWQ